ncbi:MAG: DMT family transporter [Erysipelotrichaceae bacterium]|nr:DMT family transporter [Erysipelotrichaceae bacterium]
MERKKGIIFTVMSAVLFGFTPLICMFDYQAKANSETLIFLRNLFVLPVVWTICKRKRINLRLDRKTIGKIALVGIGGTTLTGLLLYQAYIYLPVGTVTTIHFLYPVFVTLIGVIVFKEKLSKQKGMVLLFATCGIFFFLEQSNANNQLGLGILLSLLSSMTYAFYLLGVERFHLNQLNSYKLTFYLSLFSCIFALFYSLIRNRLVLFEMEPVGFLYAFLIAMGTSFLAVYFLQRGMRSLSASDAAIFSMFEPVSAIFGGWLFLNERLTLPKVLGCVIILGSVALLVQIDKNREIQS